ncbi:MAG: hypothetical protein IJJ17_05805 [Parasporobacterium sp.]|nr:hypothetical protein [Parasporobacterium sp.]
MNLRQANLRQVSPRKASPRQTLLPRTDGGSVKPDPYESNSAGDTCKAPALLKNII